jgi:chemosensory pili system protein ChpA (sensor histidine kinase/response regulator)
MASFSIDDVRETLTADVTELLSRIEQCARVLTALPEPPTDEAGPSFRAIGDNGHALHGTCSLVGAESIATSARSLERLAERGETEVRAAAAHLASARRIAETVAAGVTEMRQMLGLELEKRGDDAEWLALEWQGRAEEMLGGAGEAAKASAPRAPAPELPSAESSVDQALDVVFPDEDGDSPSFAFAEAEGAAVDPPSVATELAFDEPATGDDANDAIRRELSKVFEQEAREVVVALEGHLAALAAEPSNTTHLASVERLFHTLKGAAATIGLGAIRDDAAELQHRVEAMLEERADTTPETLAALVADANRMLARAKLPAIALSPRTPDDVARSREARAPFEREARELTDEISDLVNALGWSRGDAQRNMLDRIGAVLHRLKGSALVVGEDDAAAEAAQLEAACARGAATTAEITQGLARIVASLRLPPRATTQADEAALDDARNVFIEEARGIHAEAMALLEELGADGASVTAQAQHELASLLHRLKGSAAVVAHDAIAGEAATLQKLVIDASKAVAVSSVRQGLARIARLAGFDSPPSVARSNGAAPARAVREVVTTPAEPELWRAFTLECTELLDALERETLELEHSDAPKDRLRALMRHYHTLKGVVNTMGLTPTGAVIHRVEDFLEEILARAVVPSMRGVVSLLLQVQVEIRKNLRQAPNGYVDTQMAAIEGRVARLLAGSTADEKSRGHSEASVHSGASASEGHAHASASDAADRRFIKVATERLDVLMNLAGELVVNRSRLLSKVTLLRTLQLELGRGSKRLLETVDAFRRENEFANLDGRRNAPAQLPPLPVVIRRTDDVARGAEWSGFSDIELDRYDDVHVLSRSLAEITSDFQELYTQFQRGVATLTDDSDAFGGIISGIQNEVTRARMVPLEVLFARLRLPIRDAATRESKDVRVVTRGEDVAIDKTIADALFQPMLHLVRNSVAHGVERPDAREQRGKGASGTVTLAARQESGQIVIEVADDGAGLDLEALRERGIAMGLVASEVQANDPSIRDLVFAPQLSTQRDAGAVAGRGVGCDVVRRAVERLNGTIRVESERGRGTVFVVTLPLTLAITKALLVRHRQQLFALPLYFAERIIEAQEQRVVDSAGHRRIKLDDTFVPVRALGEVLTGTASGGEGPVIVLRVGDQRLALQVDAVLGQEEVVVKGLGTLLAGHPLFAGVTIRGTGELVLIVDVPELIDARGTATRTNGVNGAPRPAPRAPTRAARELPTSDDSAASSRELAASDDTAAPIEPPSEPDRTRLRVLFVDDSLSVRKVAEMNLKALGVDVTLAVDGLDALNRLREQTFDLVFTDLEMPRMHGYELIRELRFLPVHADLPILVVTSRSGQKHQEQARQLGATEYMTKPFTAQSLEAAIKRWGKIRTGKPRSEESGT